MSRLEQKFIPQVSSPFLTSFCVVGWKEIPSVLALMTPFLNKLSVTVGMVPVFGNTVPARRQIYKAAHNGWSRAYRK